MIRRATLAECLGVLSARLSEHLSPAEVMELAAAAAALREGGATWDGTIRFDSDCIELEDGKYTFRRDLKGAVTCLRHGAEWREFLGDKAVSALVDRVLELERRLFNAQQAVPELLAALRTTIEEADGCHDDEHGGPSLNLDTERALLARLS